MSPDINSLNCSGQKKSLLFHGTMKAGSDHRVPEFPCHQHKLTREYNANIHSKNMSIRTSKRASLPYPIHLGGKNDSFTSVLAKLATNSLEKLPLSCKMCNIIFVIFT